jgi:hypothetical protein
LWFNNRKNEKDQNMSQTPAATYYWRWFRETLRQAASFWSNLVALAIAIAILFYQVHFGVIRADQLRANEAAIFWPYLYVLGAYLLYGIARAPLVLDREGSRTINDLQGKLAQAQSALAKDSRSYSETDIAKLARLYRDGNNLFNTNISVNHPNPTAELDTWFKKHDEWRNNVLAILRERDAAIFEGRITAGSETIGHQGALNRIHGDRRGQILEELERIAKVIERHGGSTR